MTRINFRDVLGAVLVAAFIGVLGGLMWHVIPKENEQLIVYMLGQLSGFVSAVVALHYVQKAGDKELDQTRSENTGKALDLAAATMTSAPSNEAPLNGTTRPTGEPGDPVHITEEEKP